MILTGRIVGASMRMTMQNQPYWRLVISPIVRGKPTKELKYVNFHEPKGNDIKVGDYHLYDAVVMKCFEVVGASGKKFLHGVRIKNYGRGSGLKGAALKYAKAHGIGRFR